MNWFLADIGVIVVLGFIVWRRGRDRRVGSVGSARWLRIAALVPLALQAMVSLLFAFGEMASGDLSGAGHLLQVVVPALLAFLAWMRPLEGGAALFAVGALLVVRFVSAIPGAESVVISPAVMILAAPLMVSGALFFIAGMLARHNANMHTAT
jgi:hypothetical protein